MNAKKWKIEYKHIKRNTTVPKQGTEVDQTTISSKLWNSVQSYFDKVDNFFNEQKQHKNKRLKRISSEPDINFIVEIEKHLDEMNSSEYEPETDNESETVEYLVEEITEQFEINEYVPEEMDIESSPISSINDG